MSARNLKILKLMARKEQQQINGISSEIRDLRQIEMQKFDLADRLEMILNYAATPPDHAITRGALNTRHFMQQTLISQREDLQRQLAEAQTRRHTLEQDLGVHHQRKITLNDRADTARRTLADLAETAQDARRVNLTSR